MFRRPKKDSPEDPESPQDRREPSRSKPESRQEISVSLEPWVEATHAGQVDDCLVVQLDAPIEGAVHGKLEDLCIQGASVRVPRVEIPALEQDQVIALRLSHAGEGWEVVTPCQVRGIHRTDSNMARVGLEFVNPGNLYSQLTDGLGRYFNRRGAERVQPEDAEAFNLRIKVRGGRLPASVFDLSSVGLGIWVDRVLAAAVKPGDKVSYAFTLPRSSDAIEGTGRVARKIPQGRVDFLGIEFDVRSGTEDHAAAKRFDAFVMKYLGERLRWTA